MRRAFHIAKSLLVGLFAISPRVWGNDQITRAFVVAYDGWGTPERFTVSGRVLRDQGENPPRKDASEGANLIDNLKALESDEIIGAEVRVSVGGASYTATTDADGMFVVDVKGLKDAQRLPLGDANVTIDVVGPARIQGKPGAGVIHVLDDTKPFVAVVSDVDDTIVKTHVTERRKQLGTFVKNAAQLEPVAGAAVNYQRAKAAGVAVFFYVSGSPQNFHRRIHSYLEGNGFPSGPLILKNFGKDNPFRQEGYKTGRIEPLLQEYPLMKVVCVGDSGEKDPEIYKALAAKYPGRIKAIAIRTVPSSDTSAARLAGVTVIDDAYASDDVIAKLVAAP